MIVALEATLTIGLAGPWPFSRCRLGDAEYLEVGLGEFTGFYDWLRDSEGQLLGVRYWLDGTTDFILEQHRSLPYVRDAGGAIEVYFGLSRAVDALKSADQEFLFSAVFKSLAGVCALAFDIEGLGTADIDHAKRASHVRVAKATCSP